MSRALVYLGPASAIVSELNRCEQLFLARWLQLLYDEVHPRWSIRPLSLSNLSSLYPPSFDSRTKQLVFAIEDELSRRVIAAEPDTSNVNHPEAHSSDFRERVQCRTCQDTLTSLRSKSRESLPELVERLILSLDNNDEHGVLLLTPVIASEAVAAKVPLRYMMQTCRGYVLKEKTGSFRERLYGFLRHDVAQKPREAPVPPSEKCSVRRQVQLDLPAMKRIPSRMGTEALGWLWVERELSTATRRLWLSRADVEDRLNRREDAAVALRALTPGWLAVLRFCFPDVTVLPESYFEVKPRGKPIEYPGHRRAFSRSQVERAFPALEALIANDEVRASLYWLSLAYQVWGESVAHAAGMIWMSIESLVRDRGLAECANTYVDRLQSQLADDIEETLGTLAGDADSRKKGRFSAAWLTKLPRRQTASNDQAWLADLDAVARKVCDDAGLCFVLSDAASLATEGAREAVRAQTLTDLQMLRATRHAIAHRGKSIAEEPLLHYLASLGCECIRALLAKRLDGTSYEGTLEGSPIFRAECEVVNEHWHPFYIPSWITEGAGITYTSAEFADHRHELILTTEHRARLAAGEYVELVSSMKAEHHHTIRLSII